MGLDDVFLQSLTEIRCAVEPAAAALAARRRTPADITRLRTHVAQMSGSNHTPQSFAEADLEFHVAIGSASGNPLMRAIANVIEAALVASSLSSPVDNAGDHEVTANGHAAIVDAIEARDEAAAAAAMLKVIHIGVRRIDSSRKKRGAL
jgi:DNA-binding FadR family transcriptional regulator